VLFLDEPTTGLDPLSRALIWDRIRELRSRYGTTVFLTTQYLEEADELADRVAIIDQGRIVRQGTPAALKAQLGSTVIELGMGDATRAVRAEDLVARMADRPERDGATLRLTSDDGSRLLIDVLRLLDDQDLAPTTLAVRDPSMDDVFLALTGHRAQAETAANGARPGRRGARARGAA